MRSEGYSSWSVCLSVFVRLSIDDYSCTTGYEAAYERYQQLQCYKGMKNNVAILLKRLRSRDMANMHNQHWLTSTRFSPFSAPWTKGLCIQVQRCSKPTHDHAASLWEVGRGPRYVAQHTGPSISGARGRPQPGPTWLRPPRPWLAHAAWLSEHAHTRITCTAAPRVWHFSAFHSCIGCLSNSCLE